MDNNRAAPLGVRTPYLPVGKHVEAVFVACRQTFSPLRTVSVPVWRKWGEVAPHFHAFPMAWAQDHRQAVALS